MKATKQYTLVLVVVIIACSITIAFANANSQSGKIKGNDDVVQLLREIRDELKLLRRQNSSKTQSEWMLLEEDGDDLLFFNVDSGILRQVNTFHKSVKDKK